MRLAFFTMQKNERDLLRTWALYHAQLTDPGHIYIYDNGSDDEDVIADLAELADEGFQVVTSCSSHEDFERKGQVFTKLVKRLGQRSQPPDFAVPLDCDEFLLAHQPGELPSHEPQQVIEEFERLHQVMQPQDVVQYHRWLHNVHTRPGLFAEDDALRKVIITPQSQVPALNVAYQANTAETTVVTSNLSLLHYHNRDYAEMLTKIREKLSGRVRDFSAGELIRLKEASGKGFHLVDSFLQNEDEYRRKYSEFPMVRFDPRPLFAAVKRRMPFARPAEATEAKTFFAKAASHFNGMDDYDCTVLQRWGFGPSGLYLHAAGSHAGFATVADYSPGYQAYWDKPTGLTPQVRRGSASGLYHLVEGRDPNTLVLHVPPGEYLVGVFGSDPTYGDHCTAMNAGRFERHPEELAPARHQYYAHIAAMEARRGELRLRFSSTGQRWILNYVALCRAEDYRGPEPPVSMLAGLR